LLKVSSGNRPDNVAIPALDHKLPRELAETEVQELMSVSDDHAQLLIAAILNGLSLEETARLKWGDIHWESKIIQISGENARTLVPAESFLRILERNIPGKLDADLPILQDKFVIAITERELESLIARAANDARIDQPSEITSQVLRHTYISFLVRQRGSLPEIAQLTGPFPNEYQTAYALIKPPGPDIPLAEIELAYPLQYPENPA
jgi:integrase